MRISNIIWDVDMDDVYENLDEMTAEKAAEALGISQKRYANMRTDERHDYAYEVFHGHDAAIGEFMGLPTETDVPDDIDTDEDSVGDYLSDKYGYCHRGFVVDSKRTMTLRHMRNLLRLTENPVTSCSLWRLIRSSRWGVTL